MSKPQRSDETSLFPKDLKWWFVGGSLTFVAFLLFRMVQQGW